MTVKKCIIIMNKNFNMISIAYLKKCIMNQGTLNLLIYLRVSNKYLHDEQCMDLLIFFLLESIFMIVKPMITI